MRKKLPPHALFLKVRLVSYTDRVEKTMKESGVAEVERAKMGFRFEALWVPLVKILYMNHEMVPVSRVRLVGKLKCLVYFLKIWKEFNSFRLILEVNLTYSEILNR